MILNLFKWPQPTAISVFYMHPVEFIMAIIINIYIGYWVTGCHTSIFHAYLLVESFKGLMNHRLEIITPGDPARVGDSWTSVDPRSSGRPVSFEVFSAVTSSSIFPVLLEMNFMILITS